MPRRGRKPKRERSTKIPFLEGPSKAECVKQLGWLIDFANTKVEELSPPVFLGVMDKCLSFFYGSQYSTDRHFHTACADTELNRGGVECIRHKTRHYLGIVLLVNRDPPPDGRPQELKNFQLSYNLHIGENRISRRVPKRTKPYKLRGMSIIRDGYGEFPIDAGPTLSQWSDVLEKTSLVPEDPDQYDIVMSKYAFFGKFYDPDVKTTVLLSLVPVLERFPLGVIGECPECNKFFKTTRRKESPLCQRCQSRKNTYRWREEHREEYNEYQRNLQKGLKTSVDEIRAKRKEAKELKEG